MTLQLCVPCEAQRPEVEDTSFVFDGPVSKTDFEYARGVDLCQSHYSKNTLE